MYPADEAMLVKENTKRFFLAFRRYYVAKRSCKSNLVKSLVRFAEVVDTLSSKEHISFTKAHDLKYPFLQTYG